MKELIIIVPYLTDGGAERVLSELIPVWTANGIKTSILSIRSDMFSTQYHLSKDVEVIKIKQYGNRFRNILNSILEMRRIAKTKPDATLLVFNKTIMYRLAFVMPFIRNRVVVSERADPFTDPDRKHCRILRDFVFRHADACVFQTPDAQKYFPDSVKKKSEIIPNPVNPSIPERYEGEREKKIVAAGRFSGQKNFPMLLRAFCEVHSQFPEYKLYIYGRGDLENELKKLAGELGLSDCVVFPGYSENIYQDMLKCSVYVSSSDYEGISNSMLEALALGLPSVVTDCPAGGARMVIRDHVNGILVPVGDADAMSKGICEILSDDKLAETLGKEATGIRNIYPVEEIAKRWLRLF